ncbi:MAG: redoxin domain-containing protein [Desulfofustis sp.]|nr:redoxin domain-containing protein [Desulfofustis sp.]NNF46283.1 redoxin domain-containing protein [Desulfofustis sp.]NNK56485.1 redoxin domain-containing protein [Desulfofustis sp.]
MKKTVTRMSLLLILCLLLMPATSFALSVGDKAPVFTTPSSQGEISLADYEGKKHVVLALYFAVFTSV